VIYLKGEGDNEENFEPDSVQLMVDLSLLRDLDNPEFSEKPSIRDLQQWSASDYYLDVAELDPKTHSIDEYKAIYDKTKEDYSPAVYARVKESPGTGYTVLQYWLFYYLNDWRNIHEGDWELVQLHFPGQTIKELLASGQPPVFAAYSQHQAGQRMSWNDMRNQGLVSGTHPIVHVARGSHANYFTPGQFWSGLDFDDTGLSSWQIIGPEQLNIVLLTGTTEAGLEWLGFQGYWGEYLDFFVSVLGLKFGQRGPSGPQWGENGAISQKWEHPGQWADGLPEYPKPFWTAFFKLPGDWDKLAIFSLFSPATIHVYDPLGHHVGINEKGDMEKQLPDAVYIAPEGTQYQTIIIPNADVSREYTVLVNGTGKGTAEIKSQVPDAAIEVKRYLEYRNVPILPTTVARVKIEPAVTLRTAAPDIGNVRDTVTRLEMDTDGDGVFEMETTPGRFIRLEKVSVSPPESELPPVPGQEPEPAPPPPTRETGIVRIVDIGYYGQVPRLESDEFVEIANLGNSPQDITGWVLTDITDSYPAFTFPKYVLEPGAAIRVYTDEIHPEWGGFSFDYGKPIWDNETPDTAALLDAQGVEVSRKSY